MSNKRKFGISFPFSDENDDLTFVDLNENQTKSIKSMIRHIILTQKGQRIMMPDFGTDLLKYIFEPNEPTEWAKIKNDIVQQINKYLPNVSFNDIKILKNEADNERIIIEVDYSVSDGMTSTDNKLVINL